MNDYIPALIGGALIGLSATLLLAFNGRVAGISGILNSTLKNFRHPQVWMWSFMMGLFAGGGVLHLIAPQLFINATGRSFFEIVSAGFLVGFGTVMANGCTSGHGVCGISRLSPRSIVATLVFITSGFLTVSLVRWIGWSL